MSPHKFSKKLKKKKLLLTKKSCESLNDFSDFFIQNFFITWATQWVVKYELKIIKINLFELFQVHPHAIFVCFGFFANNVNKNNTEIYNKYYKL